MEWTSRQRLKWIWIACFAVLMNALAPALSQALAATPGNLIGAEICSVDDSGAPAKSSLDKMAACGYCATHAASFALLPPVLGALGLFGNVSCPPCLDYHAPRPLLALSAAPPRGPPSFA